MREGILRNSTVSLFDWIGPAFALHQKRPVTNKCSTRVFIYIWARRDLYSSGKAIILGLGVQAFFVWPWKLFFGKLADKIFLSPPGFGVGFTILCVALKTLLDNQCVRNLRGRGSTRVGDWRSSLFVWLWKLFGVEGPQESGLAVGGLLEPLGKAANRLVLAPSFHHVWAWGSIAV